MKIATYNINNVNRRLPNLLAWLKRARPDIVCLQELKAADEAFPQAPLRKAGYHALWRGQKTWNGVAILSRKPPILTRNALPGDAGGRWTLGNHDVTSTHATGVDQSLAQPVAGRCSNEAPWCNCGWRAAGRTLA